MIHKMSTNIAIFLMNLAAMKEDPDQMETYVYGLECFINTFTVLILLTMWGILSNSLIFILSWLIAFSFLRQYSGGIHMPSQWSCIFSTTLIGCVGSILFSYIGHNQVRIFLFCFIIFLLLAPIDTGKIELTKVIQWKYRLILYIAQCIIAFLFINYPCNISTAFVYAEFSAAITVLVDIIVRQIKKFY